jgi:hypothetical protein
MKTLDLGELSVVAITGIMHRALDDVRLPFGWL